MAKNSCAPIQAVTIKSCENETIHLRHGVVNHKLPGPQTGRVDLVVSEQQVPPELEITRSLWDLVVGTVDGVHGIGRGAATGGESTLNNTVFHKQNEAPIDFRGGAN